MLRLLIVLSALVLGACWPVTDTVAPRFAYVITSVAQLDGTLSSATDAEDGGPGTVEATFGESELGSGRGIPAA